MATDDRTGSLSGRQSDAELIAGLTQRDEAALRALVDSCGKCVFSKALRMLKEPMLAEEVAQDVLLVLWWEPSRFDVSRGSIRSFLMGITRFKAIDLIRREQAIHSRESLVADASTLLHTPSVNHDLEESMVLRGAISTLPVDKRKVIFLAFYEGLTYREVAEVLTLPVGTVKTRIRDSLLKLKMVLAGQGAP